MSARQFSTLPTACVWIGFLIGVVRVAFDEARQSRNGALLPYTNRQR